MNYDSWQAHSKVAGHRQTEAVRSTRSTSPSVRLENGRKSLRKHIKSLRFQSRIESISAFTMRMQISDTETGWKDLELKLLGKCAAIVRRNAFAPMYIAQSISLIFKCAAAIWGEHRSFQNVNFNWNMVLSEYRSHKNSHSEFFAEKVICHLIAACAQNTFYYNLLCLASRRNSMRHGCIGGEFARAPAFVSDVDIWAKSGEQKVH